MAEVKKSDSSAPPPAKSKGPDPLIGRVINDRFRIVSLIARGGMGKVFRAEQAPLGREVALKILNPNYSGEHDPEFHKRFFLEASVCSKLTHPNTVTIFDYGRTDDEIYYIAMELLEGRTLHRALREERPLSAERSMHIARQVCRSLREAHSLGVIHRDLKPANIFLVRHGDETDFVKVLDFGLVKDLADKGEDLTQTGLFMGSPKYMSPEQIRGEKVDARADIYSLGVILYEMLTGKVPFDRPNSVNILMAHVHEKPPSFIEANPDIEVPPILSDLVFRAIAKDPADRFASMDEFLLALKEAAASSGYPTPRSSILRLSSEFSLSANSSGRISRRPGEDPSSTAASDRSNPLNDPMPAMPKDPGLPADLYRPVARTDSSPSTPSQNRFRILATALVMGVAVCSGALLALQGRNQDGDETSNPVDETSAPITTTAPEEQDPRPPSPPNPPEPASVQIRLTSDPPGAIVAVGEREYGPTPVDVEWLGDEAAEGREVTFRFQLEGYLDHTVTRSITGRELAVEAVLTPDRRRPRHDPDGPGLEGFKADPYGPNPPRRPPQ